MENCPEWMKDNVGWIIGAIAIVLIVGGIHYFSADYPRITSIPDDTTTTGQSTRHQCLQHPRCDFHRDCKS